MEMPPSDQRNAKGDDLTLILTKIKQYNDNVKDVLEESHPKNNQDVKELICPLIPLIYDFSKTLCMELRGTTETLQTTLQTLKGLQKKSKDLNTTNDYINYLILVNQILGDTERNLKLSEEHLENIDVSSRHLVNENQDSEAANEDIERTGNDEDITDTKESPEDKVNANQEKELPTNLITNESNNSIISNNNDNGNATQEAECMDKSSLSLTEEQSHLKDTNMTCNQEVNPLSELKEDNVIELSGSEVLINETSNSADRLLDLGSWTYKE